MSKENAPGGQKFSTAYLLLVKGIVHYATQSNGIAVTQNKPFIFRVGSNFPTRLCIRQPQKHR